MEMEFLQIIQTPLWTNHSVETETSREMLLTYPKHADTLSYPILPGIFHVREPGIQHSPVASRHSTSKEGIKIDFAILPGSVNMAGLLNTPSSVLDTYQYYMAWKERVSQVNVLLWQTRDSCFMSSMHARTHTQNPTPHTSPAVGFAYPTKNKHDLATSPLCVYVHVYINGSKKTP